MKRISILLSIFILVLPGYGQTVADHTVVDRYDDIPQAYIDAVKKMWVSLAGESHSGAFRYGAQILEDQDSRYAVSIIDQGTPQPYTTVNLRLSRATWGDHDNTGGWIYDYGEEDFWTNATALTRTKAHLYYCHNSGPKLSAFALAWCWDATWLNGVGGGYDPVFHTRFAGASVYGPDGNMRWGLDDGDVALTGNSVSMLTYIRAMHEYINYCQAQGIGTAMIWTTGPVDNDNDMAIGESGYQQYLKYQYLRNHIDSLDQAWFLDFADILSYNDAGELATTAWMDYSGKWHTFPIIHPDNMSAWDNSYHFGSNGALRLAKAMWWLLARIAGWDGIVPTTWTGAGNSLWDNPANWTNGVPDRYSDVIIPVVSVFPVVEPGVEAECHNLIIEPGALLTVNSAVTEGGSLIVFGTSSGNVAFNVKLPEDDLYHYVSPPVSAATLPSSSIFWLYDEPAGDWGNTVTESVSGRGYTTQGRTTLSFQGGVVTSNVIVPATSPYADCDFPTATLTDYDLRSFASPRDNNLNYGGGGFNLMGNPFTSAMDVMMFINTNEASFDQNYKAVYIYDGDRYFFAGTELPGWANSGESYFLTDIQAGQGFFVAARCNSSLFTFTPDMQTHATIVPLLKSAGTSSAWPGAELTVRYLSIESATLVVYDEKMTLGLDPGYDVGKMNSGNGLSIYTVLASEDKGVNFVRQALPLSLAGQLKVAVGIDFPKGGEVTFSAKTVPSGNTRFWLEDRVTGTFTDLSTKSYTVTLPADTYGSGRFYILGSANTPTAIDQPDAPGDDLRIWVSGERVIISGSVSEGSLCELFDITGRKLLQKFLADGAMNMVDLPGGVHGVIVVRVTDGELVVSRKVAIL